MLRRIARYSFTILSAISLLLCVAAGVMWVRSSVVEDRLNYREQGDKRAYTLRNWTARSAAGSLCLETATTRLQHMPTKSPASLARLDAFLEALNEPNGIWRYGGSDRLVPPGASLADPGVTGWCRLGLGVIRSRAPVQDRDIVAIPYWLILLTTAWLPLWRGSRAFRHARRRRAGLCTSCGYDLRASPGRCPECGTVAKCTS